MTVRGIRGATTVESDEPLNVLEATKHLVVEMAAANSIEPTDIVSVLISTTTDVKSSFPAKAVRSIEGWKYVPVMCTHEMDVPGGMAFCIRILMHVNTDIKQIDVRHVYQKDAISLRLDLEK